MKRTVAKILCIILMQVGLHAHLAAQDRPFRIGFQASPVFSGMRNKDDLIVKNGGNLGLKLGAISDIYFKNNLSFTLGLNLAFHEGGEFLYEIGGNYLPDSELSDPLLQTGDKPLPDGVKIRYQLQYLEVPVGLKSVSYTHLRAHETVLDLVCRLLLEKKQTTHIIQLPPYQTP